jgi:hypothetical protein
VIWFFLSIVAIIVSGLTAWRWYLDARPAITQADYARLAARLESVEQVAQKTQNTVSAFAMNRTRV